MCLLTWVAVKLLLKKTWVCFKTYWHVPAVLVYTFVLWVLFRRNGAVALEVLETSRKSFEDQIGVLKKTHADEIGKRDKILEKYEDVVRALELEYAANREILSNTKKKKVKEYVREFDEDPAGLALILEETFGIKYVPTGENNE
jgi:hypothetical protein